MGKVPPAPCFRSSRSSRSSRVVSCRCHVKAAKRRPSHDDDKKQEKAAMLTVVGYQACLCCWQGGVRWQEGRDHVSIPTQQRRRSRGYALRLAELVKMLIALPLFGNGKNWTAEIANLAFAEEPYQTRNEIRNFVLSVVHQPCAQ